MSDASQAILLQEFLKKLDELQDDGFLVGTLPGEFFDIGIAPEFIDVDGNNLTIDEAIDQIRKAVKSGLKDIESYALEAWTRNKE